MLQDDICMSCMLCSCVIVLNIFLAKGFRASLSFISAVRTMILSLGIVISLILCFLLLVGKGFFMAPNLLFTAYINDHVVA